MSGKATREDIRQKQFAMIAAWEQSNQSQKQYCADNNIAYHVFHYWYKTYRREQTVGNGSFVSVNIAAEHSSHVELHLTDGRRIIFHQPVSAVFLKALIA